MAVQADSGWGVEVNGQEAPDGQPVLGGGEPVAVVDLQVVDGGLFDVGCCLLRGEPVASEVGGDLRGAVRYRAPGSVERRLFRRVHQEERARDEEDGEENDDRWHRVLGPGRICYRGSQGDFYLLPASRSR